MNRIFSILFNSKDVYFYTFAFGIVAHGFVFFNEFFSHDSLLFCHLNEQAIGFGRWGQTFLYNIRGEVFPTELICLLSLFFLAMSTALFLDLFKIKKNIYVVIVCGTLSTSFVFTIIAATYISFLDVNMLAFLLIILSCYSIKYSKKLIWKILIGSILLCLAISLYQAYFQVYTLLCCMFVLLGTISGKGAKELFKEICVYLIVLVVALILYKLSVIVSLKVSSVHSLSLGYNSLKNAEQFESIEQLVLLFLQSAPYALIKIARYPTFFGTSTKIELLLVNIFIGMYFIYKQTKSNKLRMLVSQLIYLGAVPFFANTVYILSKGLMHDTMKYSYTIVILVPLIIAINAKNHGVGISEKKLNVLTGIICTVLSLLIFSNTVFSNQAYLKKELESKSSLAIATRILDRIEMLPKFEPNKTRVCFIGQAFYNPYFVVERVKLEGKKKRITGLGNYVSFTYSPTLYFHSIMGINLPGCDNSKLDKDYVDNMPLFPRLNSVQMIEEQVVVKLGDTKAEVEYTEKAKNPIKSACVKSVAECIKAIKEGIE